MATVVDTSRKVSRSRTGLGFSLVELIVVIAITGIIAATIAVFLLGPVRGFDAQIRRAELVDAAESALRRMQRDIRAALPNSVRVDGTGRVIEMLSTVDGGRYRANPPGDGLLFNGSDTAFDVIGTLQNASAITVTPNASADWVVVNNQATTGSVFNAYSTSGHNRVRLDSTTNLAATPQHIVLQTAFPGTPLPAASSGQRFFVVNTPVTYLCDVANRTLTRYSGYAITATQPTSATVAPLSAATLVARVAEQVEGCVFTYQAGTSQRAGVVTLDLTIRDNTVNEQVRLLHQTHVYNSP